MPLKNDFLIAFKDGVVEMTTTATATHRDDPAAFLEDVQALLFEHQYRAMTDPTIMDPSNVEVSSCLVSRDPIPDEIKSGLALLGFSPANIDAGGRDESAMFARTASAPRSTLDKWVVRYTRANRVSPLLDALEASLIDEVPLWEAPDESHEASRQALVDAERTVARMLVAPSLESLIDIERQIQRERGQASARLILHPAAVRALTAFVAETILALEPAADWGPAIEGEAATLVATRGTEAIETDPELRVVRFIVHGARALLSVYVESFLAECRAL
ncbi:MAG: hypothetical protein H6729_16245 [Deltaproteobacteria bacterium]|nr:hypothetical protein [Deltaproteobacteria bacterium]